MVGIEDSLAGRDVPVSIALDERGVPVSGRERRGIIEAQGQIQEYGRHQQGA
jgi:hypothetical protein